MPTTTPRIRVRLEHLEQQDTRPRGRPPGSRAGEITISLARPVAEDDDPLLTTPEQAAYLGVGPTRFGELEKLADFPPALWLGNRGKRRLKSQLRSWALTQTTRPPGRSA